MSRLHDWVPMQLRECCFEEDSGGSKSSASVRMLPYSCSRSLTNYRERIVVVQKRVIISSGITIIARMVRSSLSTGIKRSATICSRIPIHHRSTWTCTTSMTGRKMTSLKTRPTRGCKSKFIISLRLLRPSRPLPLTYPLADRTSGASLGTTLVMRCTPKNEPYAAPGALTIAVP